VQVGQLVVLKYKGINPIEQSEKKIGIVLEPYGATHTTLWLVHWGNGKQQWVLEEYLKAVKKCP
jgi:hypothetical protein